MAANTLTARLTLLVTSLLQNSVGAASANVSLEASPTVAFANGTDVNEADLLFSNTVTIAASETLDYDLAGASMLDIFGAAVAFARIRAIVIIASSANVNDVVLGGAAAAQFFGPFGAAGDTIAVRPGGLLVLAAPDAVGWAVTPVTADVLRVANGGAGTGVTFDIVIIGASA
jgi:hypothetical protein